MFVLSEINLQPSWKKIGGNEDVRENVIFCKAWNQLGNDYTLSFITSFIKSETHLPKNKKKMKKRIFCPPSYIYRYIWFVHFSFFLSIHIWVRSINKHQSHPCNISVQNSNDKKCIDRKKNNITYLRNKTRFFKKSIQHRFKI